MTGGQGKKVGAAVAADSGAVRPVPLGPIAAREAVWVGLNVEEIG
jgi:hypothetical protein